MAQNLNFDLAVDTNSAVSSINQFFNSFDQGAAKAKNKLNQAFGQTLQTSVQINLKDGELVAKKIQNLNQESKRLETAVKAMNGQWAKTPNELRRQLSILKQLQGDTRKYQGNTNKVTTEWANVTQRIKDASHQLKKMTQGGPLQQMKNQLTGVVGKFALVQTVANLATSAVMGIARGVGDFAATAQRMEVLQLQLEAFTGSSENAAKAFDDFVEIAANSPFNLEQVASSAKIMMAFGVETETATNATERLSVVAAATGGDLTNLARNLGQIAAQGQAYTRDLTQFAIQGIPIWEEMSKVTGYTTQELKKMASEGKISFEIVQDALRNLTGEGSNFAALADRMQETFAGRFARIEAAMQKLALAFVNGFNALDRAMGGVVSGSMKLFADGLFLAADNMSTIIGLFAGLTAATVAYFALSNWYVIANGIGLVITAVSNLKNIQMALNVAKAFFIALAPGGLLKVAAAAGAAAIAYGVVKSKVDEASQGAKDLQSELMFSTDATGELTEAQEEYFERNIRGFDTMMDKYKEEKAARDEKKAELDKEIEVLEALKEKIKDKYDSEIQGIKDTLAEDRIKQDEMKESHQDRLDEINTRYDAELDLIDLSLSKLREKTAEEQKLYDFEKKKLVEKIQSGALDEEALLRAQARLSRMESQEKIAELLKEKAAVQAEKEKEITDAKAEQKGEMDELTDKIKDQEGQIKSLQAARDDEIGKIDETLESINEMTSGIDLTNVEVDEQIGLVNTLAGEYSAASSRVDDLASSLRQAAAEQRALNRAQAGSSGSSPGAGTLSARASGGPVTGGSTYQVNELGKEAFLSASGRLSMIDAKAFGSWRAPSAGTVIPAHLTKQLNIPTGGVNLNSAAASNASRAGSGGMGSMIRAIQGAMSGDTFNQSVTVQAANPVQAANNMMVEMTRLKRRRFG